MTFPVSPNKGDTYNFDDTVWVYNGRSWDRKTIGSNNSTSYANNELHNRVASLEGLPFLAGYATEAYVGTQVANLIDAAPGTLDTLNEIAAAIGDDANYATSITTAIAAVQADVDQNETDADTAIAAVQADVDANETAAAALVTTLETARNVITSAISARVTTLEADPTTATALAAVQADVDQNETDADSAIANLSTNLNNEGAARLLADNALGVRVTALEVDPTTATAVAAVQSDVDQNEADADAAIALKAALTGAVFSGDVTLKKSDGSAVALRLSRTDNADMNTEWKVQPSYVSIDKECLSIMAGSDVVASFDERQRLAINTTDPDYTLDVGGDGNFSTNLTVGAAVNLTLTDAANDSAAATAGVAVGQLYRNGSVVMIRVS